MYQQIDHQIDHQINHKKDHKMDYQIDHQMDHQMPLICRNSVWPISIGHQYCPSV